MAISDLPYLHAAGDGGPRPTTQVVVIHATANTASAAAEANYATTRPDRTSAHFYVDGASAYRALPLDHIAYGCLFNGNRISVQFELCGLSNQISDATMRQAAPLVAEVCQQYGLPIRKVSASQVAAGVTGICGHLDITAAFPQDGGDHTDPGTGFDWTAFIGYVQAAAAPPRLISTREGMGMYKEISKSSTGREYIAAGSSPAVGGGTAFLRIGSRWGDSVVDVYVGGQAPRTGVTVKDDGKFYQVDLADGVGFTVVYKSGREPKAVAADPDTFCVVETLRNVA